MSLILEALKKSERERQIGTAPTLATPPMSRKRKRNLLPWLVGAIAVAAVAGWWLSRVDTPDAAPPADVRNEAPAPVSVPVAASTRKPEVPMTTVAPAPPSPSINIEPNAAPPPAVVSTEKQAAEAAAAVAATAPPAAQPPATTTPAPAPPATSKTAPSDVGPTTSPAAVAVPPAPIATAPATSAPPVAVAPPSSTASLPLLWELPYEKRKDIPALMMSLQVYAPDPTQRFAIINDERHVEGDDLGEGLKLQEITPDGLIVEYRGERFLFPRGGR